MVDTPQEDGLRQGERMVEALHASMAPLYRVYDAVNGRLPAELDWAARFLTAAVRSDTRYHSQLLQDALVVAATDGRRDGVFVEIGVGDGEYLSNTMTLERDFGWGGLLVEANPYFWSRIRDRRPNADLAPVAALAAPAGMMKFRHVPGFPEISSLDPFAATDHHDRGTYEMVDVETVGVAALLEERGIGKSFDYLSVDIEGPDAEVLQAVLDAGYRPTVVTVEHNRVPERVERLTDILTPCYDIVLSGVSNWDMWAVLKRG